MRYDYRYNINNHVEEEQTTIKKIKTTTKTTIKANLQTHPSRGKKLVRSRIIVRRL